MLIDLNLNQNPIGLIDKIKDYTFDYAPKVIGAVLVYLIGSWAIKRLVKLVARIIKAKQYDPSLQSFLLSLIKVALSVLLLLTVIGMLGVQTTSFAALLAGLAVGIGSALNGTLGNFAGGVMILVMKPFKLGDMVEAQGQVGTIIEQGIVNTVILTADNKTVIIPNGPLSTGIITNYTRHGNLRVDLNIAIATNIEIEKARQVAIATMLNHEKVLKEPRPEVSVLKVGDNMVTLAIRPYCLQKDYWTVYFGVQEDIKNAFDENGISGPVPTRIIISEKPNT